MLACTALRAVAAPVGVAPPPLVPEDGNTYDFYVGGEEEYDSNLYRLPPGANNVATLVSPNASRSDRISVASVGGDGQWATGRQVVDLDLHLDYSHFADNGTLNNTSGYGKLLWDWQVGPYFSGTAGAAWSRALVSFGEALYLGRDLVDSPDYFGTGKYQIGPHWAVYGGVNESSISHSAPAAKSSDFKTDAGSAGLQYQVDAMDTFSVEYRYDTGRFPSGAFNTIGNVEFNPDFHDDTLLFLVTRSISDKTQLTGDVGYIKRYYPGTEIGSFSGLQWRIAVAWQPTDKTQVAFAAWHELHAYLVAESNYFTSQGGSITPTWQATEKLSVSLIASYEHQNYIPASSTVVVLNTPVSANVSQETLNVSYMPRSDLTFNLSYIHANRASNAESFQYSDDRAALTVLYKIH